jgi:hypothetical protein
VITFRVERDSREGLFDSFMDVPPFL